jgi:hypothetical protein
MLSVAGLIPHHLSYNEAKQHATQDWMWSVGDNPFATTTTFTHHFSQLHKDIAYRNYAIHSITEAVKKINQGIETLEKLSTSILHKHTHTIYFTKILTEIITEST